MADPQWTIELTVHNNKTGERREVRADGLVLPVVLDEVFGGFRAMIAAAATQRMHDVEAMVEAAENGVPTGA